MRYYIGAHEQRDVQTQGLCTTKEPSQKLLRVPRYNQTSCIHATSVIVTAVAVQGNVTHARHSNPSAHACRNLLHIPYGARLAAREPDQHRLLWVLYPSKFPGQLPAQLLCICRPPHFPVPCMSVMLSPLINILPSDFLVFRFTETSSASSSTKFMYSSNPMIRPSILRSDCSNNHSCTFCRLCKNRKIRLMGWVIIRLTLGGILASLCYNDATRQKFEGLPTIGKMECRRFKLHRCSAPHR